MKRCRICDVEFPFFYSILDDDLCPECEDAVLDTLTEWETEDDTEESQ